MSQSSACAENGPPIDLVAGVVRALAESGQPAHGYAALSDAFEQCLGHKLFTVLFYDVARAEARRCYSNQPDAYPVGGTKPVEPSSWTMQVLNQQLPFTGSTYDDIREVFFDHALIRSLGCESVLNLPVVYDGRTLGALNLLHEAHWYDAANLDAARVLAGLAVPALLAEIQSL